MIAATTVRKLARRRLEKDAYARSLFEILFVPGILAVLLLYLGLTAHGFFTAGNLINILLQGSILALVAFGMTFVILAGELDLSVGSGVALASVVSALAIRDSSIFLGVIAAIGCGFGIGLFNGLVVTRLEVPSFIATLATLVIAHGIALALTNGAVIGPLPPGIGSLANDSLLGIRWLIWLVALVFILLFLLQSRTTLGIKVKAVGGNREAARLSAIRIDRVRIACFIIAGICAGIGGLAVTARVQSGQPNTGNLLALTAVAAVVVGGTSLTGGRGGLVRTLWGVLLLTVLDNGLDVKGVNPDVKSAIIGAVFIAAASVDFIRRNLSRRRADVLAPEREAGVPPPAAEQATAQGA